MDPQTITADLDGPLHLQLWKLVELLRPVTDATSFVFDDPHLAVDELRLRIKAAMLELESLKRENVKLMKALAEQK